MSSLHSPELNPVDCHLCHKHHPKSTKKTLLVDSLPPDPTDKAVKECSKRLKAHVAAKVKHLMFTVTAMFYRFITFA